MKDRVLFRDVTGNFNHPTSQQIVYVMKHILFSSLSKLPSFCSAHGMCFFMNVSNAMHFLFDVMKPSYNYSGTHFNSHFEKSSVQYRCYGKLYAMSFNFDTCIVCGKDDADGLSNVQRGIQAVLDYTELYSVDLNHQLVNHLKTENAGVKIHRHCQKNLNRSLRKRKCSDEYESGLPKKTRRQTGEFTWKEHCFYCGGQCDDEKHPD